MTVKTHYEHYYILTQFFDFCVAKGTRRLNKCLIGNLTGKITTQKITRNNEKNVKYITFMISKGITCIIA